MVPLCFLPNPSSHLILHQSLQEDDKPFTYFAPCIPIPRVWDQARYLKDLKDALNPECPHYCFIEGMHPTYVPSSTPMKWARCRATARFISREEKWFQKRRQTLEIPSSGLRFVPQNNNQIAHVTDYSKILASGAYCEPASEQTGVYASLPGQNPRVIR